MTAFLLGVIVGLIVAEFLPADIVNKLGKIKVKNSTVSGVPANTLLKQRKKRGFLGGVFRRKNRGG